MNKQQAMALAYWVMIIAVILTCVFVVLYLQTNATSCLNDPIAFYQNKMSEQCYCMANMGFTP